MKHGRGPAPIRFPPAGKPCPPVCPCGHDVKHGLVRDRPDYRFIPLMLVMFVGGIGRPWRLTRYCPHCMTALEIVTDPVRLNAFQ